MGGQTDQYVRLIPPPNSLWPCDKLEFLYKVLWYSPECLRLGMYPLSIHFQQPLK